MLLRFKGIETNYLNVYPKKFIFKISHMNFFYTFHSDTKRQVTTQKNQMIYKGMIKSFTQHSYFEKKPNKDMGRLQNNPSIGWVHPNSTHAHPLACLGQ